MKKIKVGSTILLGLASLGLLAYGWINKLAAKPVALASASSNEACLEDEKPQNPHSQLFISCGGFLE